MSWPKCINESQLLEKKCIDIFRYDFWGLRLCFRVRVSCRHLVVLVMVRVVLPKVALWNCQVNAMQMTNDEECLSLGFTRTTVGNEERPQCVICLKLFVSDNIKPDKLRHHLKTSHPELKEKPVEVFRKKLLNCLTQQSHKTSVLYHRWMKQKTVTSTVYW